jgi:hypothetical protein
MKTTEKLEIKKPFNRHQSKEKKFLALSSVFALANPYNQRHNK